MRLKTTVTFTWYHTITEDDIQLSMKLNEQTREEVLKDVIHYEKDETISRLEGRLDNCCVEDWSSNVKMEWAK